MKRKVTVQCSDWRSPITGSSIPGKTEMEGILLSRPDLFPLMRLAAQEADAPGPYWIHPYMDEVMEKFNFPACPEGWLMIGGIKDLIWEGKI